MEKITKNPGLNNFLLKYDKRDWDQVVLKLSLIALSYLKTLPETKIFYSLNELDQVLYKLEDYNISQMGNKKFPKQKKNKKKQLGQIYKPPIENQLKGKKISKENLEEENLNDEKKNLDNENINKYNSLLNDNLNYPFLNKDNQASFDCLKNYNQFNNYNNYNNSNILNEFNHCSPCNDPCCLICRKYFNPFNENNLNFEYGNNMNTGFSKNKSFRNQCC